MYSFLRNPLQEAFVSTGFHEFSPDCYAALLTTVFQALPLLKACVDRHDLLPPKPAHVSLFSALVALGLVMSDHDEVIDLDKRKLSLKYADKASESFSSVIDSPLVAQAALVLSIHESCVRTSNASWVWNTIGAKVSLNCVHSRLRSKSDGKTLLFAAWMDLQNAMANGQSLSLPTHWSVNISDEKTTHPESQLLGCWKELLTLGRQVLNAWNYNKVHLHQELIVFWEELPASFKLSPSLSIYVESNQSVASPPISSSSILDLNLMFLAIFSLLHSNKSTDHVIFPLNGRNLSSVEMVILTYRALNDILQRSLSPECYSQLPYLSSYIHVIVNAVIEIPYLQTTLLFQNQQTETLISPLETHIFPTLAKSNEYWPCAGIFLKKLETQLTEWRQELICNLISSELMEDTMETEYESEMGSESKQEDGMIPPKTMTWDFSVETLFEDSAFDSLISS
jgi:hypothetical protein